MVVFMLKMVVFMLKMVVFMLKMVNFVLKMVVFMRTLFEMRCHRCAGLLVGRLAPKSSF